ncbi:DUF5058 family protein [Candidatus Xianfuyuplasma coldseepsis]|uniref:DUF5058 family protein n=1 Tax=Candidatus Xianfuyuplasma coldseepsis TaxID=2782163 RepID=A0A7L7KRH4_9MOLU|nr:DUF5058 family protein [Xianfuyuplasma coldseepsis]QMS85307.1 DUF5058 family protein [Xianfuyuplasma coldseepsis]
MIPLLISITDVKEAPWLYIIGAFVTIFIISGSLFFAYHAYQRSKELNMDSSLIKKTIVSSISFSVLPSIGIFIGVITMSGFLGIPLPWIRLSVLGALHYELMAADLAVEGVNALNLTVENFVTIAFTMTIAIIWGSLFTLFLFKKYQAKVVDKATTKEGRSFGPLLFQGVFIGLISAYFGDAFSRIFGYNARAIVDGVYSDEIVTKTTVVPLIVFVVSFATMAGLDYLVTTKKMKWLENFQLSFSMLIGMSVAVLLGMGGIY